VVSGFLLALYIPQGSRSASTATPNGYLAWVRTPRERPWNPYAGAGGDLPRLTRTAMALVIREIIMRENVLSDLTGRAATESTFLKQTRRDLEGTLARLGYELTREELRLVEGFRRRTAGMSDEQLARTPASGLRGRTGSPPARPSTPSWRDSGRQDPHDPGVDGGECKSRGRARSRRWSIPTGMEGSR
jgi:hypothetical protein